jgi:type I restriction enzyme S subunit
MASPALKHQDQTESVIEPGAHDVPEEWRTVKLHDITLKTSQSDPKKNPSVEFQYVDVSSVSREWLKIHSSTRYKGAEAPSRARKRMSAGDVLFATVRPSLRRVALVPSELQDQVCSTAFCVIRADPEQADSRFLFFAVASEDFVRRVSSHQRGSSYPAVTDKDVREQTILLPPLAEQRAIAAILDTVYQAQEATADVIAATHELKNSLTRHLFTYGLEPINEVLDVDLQDTEIGPIPSRWQIQSLDGVALAPLRNGIFVKNPTWGAGVSYLNVADVYPNAAVDINDLQLMQVPEARVKAFSVVSGDLVFVRSSLKRDGVAMACLVPETAETLVFDCHLIRVSPDPSVVNPHYLVQYCRSALGHPRLVSLSKTTTMTTIPQANLARFNFPLPPLEEQKAIAAVLDALDRKIRVEQERATALDSTLKSLVHDFMTGKRRASPEEEVARA